MKSFLKLLSISVQGQLYYRTSFFVNLLTPLVLLGGQYLLWTALYAQQGGQSIGSMGQREMYTYILVAFALNNMLGWSAENTLAKEIRSGTIVSRCIRPVSFLSQSLAGMLGAVLVQGAVYLLVVIAGFLCFGRYLAVPSLKVAAVFVPCFLMALLLRIMLVDISSLLCFFSTGYLGIAWTRTAIFDFFSGAMVPVAMFPGWLKSAAYLTPFPYMLQAPIALLIGQGLPLKLPAVYGMQAFWLVIFAALHGLIYRQARKNLTVAGG